MKIPSYLEVISVIDHHKSSLLTGMPPTAFITDAQAASALVAHLSFTINDQYSLGGLSEKTLTEECRSYERNLTCPKAIRIYQRLLQRKKNLSAKKSFWINPLREFVEYLHFTYAILDDTDLLTKVSRFDVLCIAKLLNRLKSLILKKEVEIIQFDDLEEDETFTAKAAKRLVTNRDFYSLYSKVYRHKERAIEENLTLCAEGKESNIFSDAKTVNGCARVSQTKLFACNYPKFAKCRDHLRDMWYSQAKTLHSNNSDILLHMHMISTIASADALFAGNTPTYEHFDELWLWIPPIELAAGKLKLFLNAFKSSSRVTHLTMRVALLGENAEELAQIFQESFLPVDTEIASKKTLPLAIIYFNAGMLNSRKAMIAPCIPRLDQ